MYRLVALFWDEPVGGGQYKRHHRGAEVKPPKHEVERLLKAGAIEPVAKPRRRRAKAAKPEPSVAEQEAVAETDQPVEAAAAVPEDGPAENEDAPERPRMTATRDVWAAYAVEVGLDPAEAAVLGRDELIEKVG